MIKEIKNTAPWAYVFTDLNNEKIVGTVYDKKLPKEKSERIQD